MKRLSKKERLHLDWPYSKPASGPLVKVETANGEILYLAKNLAGEHRKLFRLALALGGSPYPNPRRPKSGWERFPLRMQLLELHECNCSNSSSEEIKRRYYRLNLFTARSLRLSHPGEVWPRLPNIQPSFEDKIELLAAQAATRMERLIERNSQRAARRIEVNFRAWALRDELNMIAVRAGLWMIPGLLLKRNANLRNVVALELALGCQLLVSAYRPQYEKRNSI